jgi:hypothetical protein
MIPPRIIEPMSEVTENLKARRQSLQLHNILAKAIQKKRLRINKVVTRLHMMFLMARQPPQTLVSQLPAVTLHHRNQTFYPSCNATKNLGFLSWKAGWSLIFAHQRAIKSRG